MYLTSFRVAEAEKEALLDALLPLLPGGRARERRACCRCSPACRSTRSVMEAAVGPVLHGWKVEEVPADWRSRRALLGGGGVIVGGRVSIRSPWDAPPARTASIDVVVERRGSAFGSGSHPTTQMCVALMLDLESAGGAADLGCGVGTLAIVAAKLGWAPVVGRGPRAGGDRGRARERRAQRGRRRVLGRRSRRRRRPARLAAAGQRAAARARAGRRGDDAPRSGT